MNPLSLLFSKKNTIKGSRVILPKEKFCLLGIDGTQVTSSDLSVTEGGNVTLSCVAHGQPRSGCSHISLPQP